MYLYTSKYLNFSSKMMNLTIFYYLPNNKYFTRKFNIKNKSFKNKK